jgi:hypothetical protein
MKRIAESPVQSERSKDQRIISPMASMTYAGALRGSRQPQPLPGVVVPEDGHTLQTEGAMRNNFTVDIFKKNGEDFKGTVKHSDAVKLIFVCALGFKPQDLAGVVPGYRGNPTVLFKTKEVFNIDEKFANLVRFSFLKRLKTSEGEITDTYDCAIRGVRGKEGQRNDPYTWIKVEGSDYQVEPTVIRMWLSQYGTLMTELMEDKVELELSSEEEELYQGAEITTGTYSTKMLLHKPIPQFLPIAGKKVRIYYRGIAKLCTKCYRQGHLRQACRSEQDNWLSYVDRFMLGSLLAETFFGKWRDRIIDWRKVNSRDHEANLEEMSAREREEIRRREARQGEVESIIGHLNAQSKAQAENSTVPPLEEEGDDRVEEVIPSTSTDEECITADIQQKVVHPSMTKESIASQQPNTSNGIREKMSGLTVDRSTTTGRNRVRKTTVNAVPTLGKDQRSKARSNSLGNR